MTTATNSPSTITHLDGSIGILVWWNLEGTAVTPARLRAILAGEQVATTVPDIEPTSAISRASREFKHGARSADGKYRAEVTHKDANNITVGVLHRERKDSTTVGWEQVGWMEYDVTAGAWSNISTTNPDHDDAVQAFASLAAGRLANLDHEWIRPNVIMKFVAESKAICLRRGGGFYFVPRTEIETMQRLGRIIDQLGNSSLSIATLGGDEATRASVAAEATSTLHQEITEVEDRIAAWEDSVRKVSTTSQASVLNSIGDLLDRASLYEDVLDQKLTGLRERISAARSTALAVIADGGTAAA